ncbi:MAG: hypothetical protein JNK84_04630 [Phreatobacter sp.]|nr:hypothetical protein [Phreatobacter sp.]MBL8568350.1 hypothetical protein [Phreatobacter sp.]
MTFPIEPKRRAGAENQADVLIDGKAIKELTGRVMLSIGGLDLCIFFAMS